VQFTVERETHRKLRAVQDLMRHVVPDGDIAEIFDRAITMLLREVERRKFADAQRPRSAKNMAKSSCRHMPAAVKRAVWARDQGQCAFVGGRGRCGERGLLEFHHVIPFADGGATTTENLQLRCRAHNAHEAHEHFELSASCDAL
jgi:HNH endonuclease